jgi:hypothetical protein
MTSAPAEPKTRPTPAALGAGFDQQALFAKPFTGGGEAVVTGLQNLMQAYQAMARRNGEKLTASMQALAAVKTPTEFVELQRKLLAESVAEAVSDSATIGKLTATAFTAAFEPMRKQIEQLQGGLKP